MNATIRPSETVVPTRLLAAQQEQAADARDERHRDVAERFERRLRARWCRRRRGCWRRGVAALDSRKRLDILVLAIERLRLAHRRQVLLEAGVDARRRCGAPGGTRCAPAPENHDVATNMTGVTASATSASTTLCVSIVYAIQTISSAP